MTLTKSKATKGVLLCLSALVCLLITDNTSNLPLMMPIIESYQQYQYYDRNEVQQQQQQSSFELFELDNPSSFSPSPLDRTIHQRLSWDDDNNNQNNNNNNDKCNRILLYLPAQAAGHGHGWQLLCYLMAASIAAFTNMAMVIMEPPANQSRFDTGSQFGCPADAFEEGNNNNKKVVVKEGFPNGILRLIQHPHWISRGCSVPPTTSCNNRGYNEWYNLAEKQKYLYRGRGKRNPPPPTSYVCGNSNQSVTPMNAGAVRTSFDMYFKHRMTDRSSPQSKVQAYGWAVRFGATKEEAEYFSTVMSPGIMGENIHKFISALANRSGLLTLQPWIVRDVIRYLQRSKLVLPSSNNNNNNNNNNNVSYDAIHVRRGDKLLKESGAWVAQYWTSRGYAKGKFPTNYIPFKHYIEMGWKDEEGGGLLCSTATTTPPKSIFVATDDPTQVKKEISHLPQLTTDYGSCKETATTTDRFVFPASSEATSFHVTPCRKYKKTCAGDNCHKRYQRIIAAVGDMMILSRADKLVCDYNSSWGRIIKGFRTVFDDGSSNTNDGGDNQLLLTNRVVVRDTVDLSPWRGRFTPFGY